MRALVQMFVRLLFIFTVVYVCLAGGWHIQIIGFIVSAWVLYRAAPGLWQDIKGIWSIGKKLPNSKLSFRGGFKMKEDIGL
jgi:hypothetical protein